MSAGGMARGGPAGTGPEAPSALRKSMAGASPGRGERGLGAPAQPPKKSASSTPPSAQKERPTRGRTGAGFSATMGALEGVKLS